MTDPITWTETIQTERKWHLMFVYVADGCFKEHLSADSESLARAGYIPAASVSPYINWRATAETAIEDAKKAEAELRQATAEVERLKAALTDAEECNASLVRDNDALSRIAKMAGKSIGRDMATSKDAAWCVEHLASAHRTLRDEAERSRPVVNAARDVVAGLTWETGYRRLDNAVVALRLAVSKASSPLTPEGKGAGDAKSRWCCACFHAPEQHYASGGYGVTECKCPGDSKFTALVERAGDPGTGMLVVPGDESAPVDSAKPMSVTFPIAPAEGDDRGCACIVCGLPSHDGPSQVGADVEYIVGMRGQTSRYWRGLHAKCLERTPASVSMGDPLAESNDLPPELEHPANKMAREAMRVDSAKGGGEDSVMIRRYHYTGAVAERDSWKARAESAEAERDALRRELDRAMRGEAFGLDTTDGGG